MSYLLAVDRGIFESYPSYTARVVYASDLDWSHQGAPAYAEQVLRDAELSVTRRFAGISAASHPHLSAWRAAFERSRINPNRFPNGAEALIKRVLKGKPLPSINPGVDLYNAISLQYALPVGGENRSALVSDLRLKFARGDEPFDVAETEGAGVSYPGVGEPIWADSAGVTCRRWNHRQSQRTRLTDSVSDAYFVLDRLEPMPLPELEEAASALAQHLKRVSPDCSISHSLLTRSS